MAEILRNMSTLQRPLGLASKLIHILERRSITPSCVVRRLNRLAIRAPLALLDEHLDAPKCECVLREPLPSHTSQRKRGLPDYANKYH
jgi:hypothetical protein